MFYRFLYRTVYFLFGVMFVLADNSAFWLWMFAAMAALLFLGVHAPLERRGFDPDGLYSR